MESGPGEWPGPRAHQKWPLGDAMAGADMSRPYSTFKKRGKGLASCSAKRLSEHELRQAVRLAVLERDGHRGRLDPRSQFYPGHEWSGGFRLPDVPSSCGGPLDVHDPLKRSRGGNYLDADQCVVLCRNRSE